MSATFWLLLAIALTLLTIICICAFVRGANLPENAAECRTADWRAIERDTAALQAKVPSPPARSACTGNCNQGRNCTCSLPARKAVHIIKHSAVRAEATRAALLDACRSAKAVNPYAAHTQAHQVWATEYERVTADSAHSHTA